jgi:Phosphoinositide phospholipase C, Ca2+-dependent
MRRTGINRAAAALALVAAGGLLSSSPATARERELRLNQIQVIGTHNSYHVEASPIEEAARAQVDPIGELALEYGHPALTQQFSDEAVRQIELDVFADPAGGLYAAPLIRALTGEGPYDPAMAQPGFKVLHLQDIDYRSTCLTLASCLTELKTWSDGHRSHVPIAVLIELKDDPLVLPGAPPLVTPVPWTGPLMDQLDAQIRSVFPPRRLITPDAVRDGARTLEAAVRHEGWPSIADSRGKVMFLMDNAGSYRTTYLAGHPSLRGRVLFTNSRPGQPDAAFVEENDPTGAHQAQIAEEVRQGYLVRTRADADTVQARTGDTSQRDAALASGAQWVSTDYPVPGIAARFGTSYVAQLPGGVTVRCNPISAPDRCRAPAHP